MSFVQVIFATPLLQQHKKLQTKNKTHNILKLNNYMCYDLNNQKVYKTLSAENKKIVDLLLEGKNNKTIAIEMNMSVKTLEKKLTTLYALFDLEDKDKEKRTRLFVKIINFLRGKA